MRLRHKENNRLNVDLHRRKQAGLGKNVRSVLCSVKEATQNLDIVENKLNLEVSKSFRILTL